MENEDVEIKMTNIIWSHGIIKKNNKIFDSNILQNLELKILGVRMFSALWNLADTDSNAAGTPDKSENDCDTPNIDIALLRPWEALR